MLIGGLQKLSLVDYPGKTCISLFTIGCNMRCGFCHNKELVVPTCFVPALDNEQVMKFIKSRRKLVEAVTISGGEPTLQPDLAEFICQIKALGFLVKLDSNGTKPQVLEDLIKRNLLDFIAMDVKAPLKNYQKVTNRPIVEKDIKASIQLIKSSGLGYEFRTTVVKGLHKIEDFDAIGKLISQGGKAKRYALQRFLPAKTLDPKFATATTLSDDDFELLKQKMTAYADEVVLH